MTVSGEPARSSGEDQVVLLDDAGRRIGTAGKRDVHTAATPLHLAFSCHVRDRSGRMLVTRRSLTKRTWPGVWTNAFCGHPRPHERMIDAVRRHADTELGMRLWGTELVLPDFRYRAVDPGGVVENEVCPVYAATSVGTLRPDPLEVAEVAWVDPTDLGEAIRRAPWAFSPWLVLQAQRLPFLYPAADGGPG